MFTLKMYIIGCIIFNNGYSGIFQLTIYIFFPFFFLVINLSQEDGKAFLFTRLQYENAKHVRGN